MPSPLRILIVEDSEDDTLIMLRDLKEYGFDIFSQRVETEASMRSALQEHTWDAILCDYRMPDFDALRAVALVHESDLDMPVILISCAIGEETAVAAMKTGIHDYIFKDNLNRLGPALERELAEAKFRQERRQAREDLKRANLELEQRVEARTEDLRRAMRELQREMAERLRVSDSLQHAQEWLALAQRAGRIGMFEWDVITGRIFWTPELEHLFGLRPGSFEGTFAAWMARICAEDVEWVEKELREWLTSDLPGIHCRCRYLHVNGETRWMDVRAQATRSDSGEAQRVVGAGVDITDLKVIEDALRVSEDKYRILADASPALIWSAAADGRVNFVNARWYEFTGFTEDQINRLGWEAVCHPDDAAHFSAHWFERAAKGQHIDTEIRYRRADGEYRWFMNRTALVRNESNAIVRWLSVSIDITERKQMEELLRQNQVVLEERVRERTAALTSTNMQLQREITERVQAESKLKVLASELEDERGALSRKNIALQELLETLKSQRGRFQEDLVANIEGTILPLLQLLKTANPPMIPAVVNQLEQTVTSLWSPMSASLKGPLTRLSPREVQICNYIRNGMSTKEIADVLTISPKTVQKNREVIRKKLGLTNQDDSLISYLQTLSESAQG